MAGRTAKASNMGVNIEVQKNKLLGIGSGKELACGRWWGMVSRKAVEFWGHDDGH